MSPPVGERLPSQGPYKYGMMLLCMGALLNSNWLGLAQNYFEPIRYMGVVCIITGAMLIFFALWCWLTTKNPTPPTYNPNEVHVIDMPPESSTVTSPKPPDYDSITTPPSYDIAIKLNPAHVLNDTTTPESVPGETTISTSRTNIPDDSPPPIYDVANKLNPGQLVNDNTTTTPESVPGESTSSTNISDHRPSPTYDAANKLNLGQLVIDITTTTPESVPGESASSTHIPDHRPSPTYDVANKLNPGQLVSDNNRTTPKSVPAGNEISSNTFAGHAFNNAEAPPEHTLF